MRVENKQNKCQWIALELNGAQKVNRSDDINEVRCVRKYLGIGCGDSISRASVRNVIMRPLKSTAIYSTWHGVRTFFGSVTGSMLLCKLPVSCCIEVGLMYLCHLGEAVLSVFRPCF